MKRQYPKELTSRPRWGFSSRHNGKLDKCPLAVSGGKGSSTDSTKWATHDAALYHANLHDGEVGYMMGEGLYTVIDLDAPKKGTAEEKAAFMVWARDVASWFDSYTELSQSGEGIHIFVEGQLPTNRRKRKGGIEIYSDARYLLVTGNHLPGTPHTIEPRDSHLRSFYLEHFDKEETKPRPKVNLSSRIRAGMGDINDVLDILPHTKNGQKVLALYHNTSGGSEDDMALIMSLAFYLPDPVELYKAFRNSPAFREDQIARRGGEAKYERWCMTQNINKAIDSLTESFDWTKNTPTTTAGKHIVLPKPKMKAVIEDNTEKWEAGKII